MAKPFLQQHRVAVVLHHDLSEGVPEQMHAALLYAAAPQIPLHEFVDGRSIVHPAPIPVAEQIPIRDLIERNILFQQLAQRFRERQHEHFMVLCYAYDDKSIFKIEIVYLDIPDRLGPDACIQDERHQYRVRILRREIAYQRADLIVCKRTLRCIPRAAA